MTEEKLKKVIKDELDIENAVIERACLVSLSMSCFIKQKVRTIFLWFSQICLLMMLKSNQKTH